MTAALRFNKFLTGALGSLAIIAAVLVHPAAAALTGAETGSLVEAAGAVRHYLDKWTVAPKLSANVADVRSTVDGRLSEAWWEKAAPVTGFRTAYYERPVPGVEYRFAFDDHYLYLGGTIPEEEAGSIAQIELVIKPRPASTLYYVVSIPVSASHPSSMARLNTIWNPSPNELSNDEGRVNVEGALASVSVRDGALTVEAAVPLKAVAAAGVSEGDEWQLNVVHVHHLYTRPLTAWVPIRNSSQWDTGQSRSGGSVTVYADVVGQGRMGSLFFGRLPNEPAAGPGAAGPHRAPRDSKETDILLMYVDFTRKRLLLPSAWGAARGQALEVRWKTPRGGWQTVTDLVEVRSGERLAVEFAHPGPLADGIYKLMVTYRAKDARDTRVHILTFDRESLIQAGLAVSPRFPVSPANAPPVEWSEPSEEVLAAIELIPPQPGFRHAVLPEMPELYPDGTGIYRLSSDQKHLVALPTGTIYPSDDPRLKESKELRFTDRKGDEAIYPYFEDAEGRQYFITGHLWYLQKEQAIRRAAALANADPLGAARVLYAFALAYDGYHPTVDRNWINGVVPADSGPPYPYWGGTWNRWWWSDLATVSRLAAVYAAIKPTGALKVLSDEVGEDVERKLIEDMFLPSVDFVLTYPISQGNMAATLWQGLIQMGLALREPDLIHRAVELIQRFVTEGKFLSDGFWSEVTLSYHTQTINGLVRAIEMLNGWTDPPGYVSPRTGVRFDNLDMAQEYPIIGKALAINRFMVYPDGRYLPIMDTWANQSSPSPDLSKGSFLLPAAKVARLAAGRGSAQTQINVNFQPKYGHVHRDGINITLFANGRELLPDIGYSHNSKYRWFTTSTIGHNTVVVDGQDMPNNAQARHGGNIEAFVQSSLFQVVRASYAGPYAGVTEYARELWLIPFASGAENEAYILDIFRIEGGRRHEYTLQGDANRDALFRVDVPTRPYGPYLLPEGTRVIPPTGPSTPGSAQGHYPGYIYIRDVEHAELAGEQFTVTLLIDEYGVETPSLRMTGLLADDRNELFLGRSPSLRPVRQHGISMDNNHMVDLHSMPKLVLRREGSSLRSDFVMLMEPRFGDGAFRIDAAERLAVERGPQGAVAVRVIYDDTIDIILSNPRHGEGPLVAGDLELHGEFAFVRLKDGVVQEVTLVGGARLKMGRAEWTGRGRATGAVDRTLRRADGDPVDGFATDAEIAGSLSGRYVIITHPDGSTSGFAIDRVEREGNQTVIVFAEHDPAFVIEPDGTSRQVYYPRKAWVGTHTFDIAYVDELAAAASLYDGVGAAPAASGVVAGVVRDAEGRPVPGALVRPAGYSTLAALTDEDGRFELSGLPAGRHWFKVSHDLFAPSMSGAVTVSRGSRQTIALTVGDRLPPRLFDVPGEVFAGEPIPLTSSQDATVYLLRGGASRGIPTAEAVRSAAVASVQVEANQPALLQTEKTLMGAYTLYAVDAEGRVSSGVAVRVRNREEEERLIKLLEGWQ